MLQFCRFEQLLYAMPGNRNATTQDIHESCPFDFYADRGPTRQTDYAIAADGAVSLIATRLRKDGCEFSARLFSQRLISRLCRFNVFFRDRKAADLFCFLVTQGRWISPAWSTARHK